MKKILGLTITALLVMGLIGGGTWAYFSDVETSSGNILTAGTLNLKLTGGDEVGDSVTGTFTASEWKPSETEIGNLVLYNTGSIDMANLTLNFTYGTDVDNEDGSIDITGRPDNIYLNDPLEDTDAFDKQITVTSATWNDVPLDGTGGTYDLEGESLYTLRNGGAPLSVTLPVTGTDTVPLPAGKNYTFAITFEFASGAENGCQGNALTMKIIVTGTQH